MHDPEMLEKFYCMMQEICCPSDICVSYDDYTSHGSDNVTKCWEGGHCNECWDEFMREFIKDTEEE
jgi:hypothetical protein